MMQLNPDVKYIWAISYGFRTIFFMIMFFAAEFFVMSEIEKWPFFTGFLPLVILFIGIVFTSIFPTLKYKNWFFELRDDELFLKRGVLTKVASTAPYCRIQHIDIAQGVFERMFNLSRLVIFTAGTRGADLVIPGLPLYYAQQLRDELKEYTVEDAV